MLHPVPRGRLPSKIAGSELGSAVPWSLSLPNIRMFLATDIRQQPGCPDLCLRPKVIGRDLFYILLILNLQVSQTHSQYFYQRVMWTHFHRADEKSRLAKWRGWLPDRGEFSALLLKDNQGSPWPHEQELLHAPRCRLQRRHQAQTPRASVELIRSLLSAHLPHAFSHDSQVLLSWAREESPVFVHSPSLSAQIQEWMGKHRVQRAGKFANTGSANNETGCINDTQW